jgi:hypothetical protein
MGGRRLGRLTHNISFQPFVPLRRPNGWEKELCEALRPVKLPAWEVPRNLGHRSVLALKRSF